MTMVDSEASPTAGTVAYEVIVLLVDDQLIVGEVVRRALASEPDVKFHHCADPLSAMAAARAVKPTVILQDLVMPDVHGLDLVGQYRADDETKGIPIIVLSAKEDSVLKRDAFKAGANDYLVKLPDSVELIARIRYHSLAYISQRQRDEANLALRKSQQKLLETNRKLERLTRVDGLTGLSNRRYFDECLEAEWKRAIRTRNPLSVLMIDVDFFKLYNDTYGHVLGDAVLRKVAHTLTTSFKRSTDVVARFGGEEFAVILPDTPNTNVLELAKQICNTVAELRLAHVASEIGQHVTISVGCATTIPERGQSFSPLIEAADQALYEAKRTGRGRAVACRLETSAPC